MQEADANEKPPKDRYKAVFLILLLHGIGMLMPWNMFITARSYFVEYKMSKNYTGEDTNYTTYFLQSVGFASQIPNIIFNWINVFINIRGSVTPRVVLTLTVEIIIFIVTIILAVTNTSECLTAFFWSTMIIIVILNMSEWNIKSSTYTYASSQLFFLVANGIYQNTVFGIAAKLPSKYSGSVILGCDISGTLVSIIELLTNVTAPHIKAAATYYFIIALLILLICLVTYFVLFQSKFYRYYQLSTVKPSQRTNPGEVITIPYWRIFKSAFLQLFNIFFIFFVTLSIFPELQANIKKSDSNFIIPEKYYVQVMCFITFNTTTMLGCILSNLINWPSPKVLLIPVLLRVLFIPFFFFCNYQPTNKVRKVPVLISNDWVYWVAGILMGFTSGFLSTKALIYIKGSVEGAYVSISGMFGAAVLVTGIFFGVLFSMIFPCLAEV